MKATSFQKTQYIAKIGILSALAALVMLVEIPLWFAPSFYELDLSEIVVLLGGFSMGPVAGVLIEFFKVLLKLLIKGTTTAYVGDLANFLIGCAFVIPAAIIYRFHGKKSRKRAMFGLVAGGVTMTVVGAVINYFILIPFFSRFYGIPLDGIISMGTALNGWITDLKTLVFYATTPFNLFKAVVDSVITAIIYPYLSPFLKKDYSLKHAMSRSNVTSDDDHTHVSKM